MEVRDVIGDMSCCVITRSGEILGIKTSKRGDLIIGGNMGKDQLLQYKIDTVDTIKGTIEDCKAIRLSEEVKK